MILYFEIIIEVLL